MKTNCAGKAVRLVIYCMYISITAVVCIVKFVFSKLPIEAQLKYCLG